MEGKEIHARHEVWLQGHQSEVAAQGDGGRLFVRDAVEVGTLQARLDLCAQVLEHSGVGGDPVLVDHHGGSVQRVLVDRPALLRRAVAVLRSEVLHLVVLRVQANAGCHQLC
eukprot:scaffold1152_cov235-Pinguiococcus_pyrenoidosus.AAC.6